MAELTGTKMTGTKKIGAMVVMRTEEVLQLMVEVAEQVIRPRFRALHADQIDEKSPGDFVTVADRESEALLTKELVARNPGCLIVGEEATFADPNIPGGLGSAEIAYTVDPVDGTGNFVRGNPHYAVMIAEIRRTEVTRSWILHPESGDAFVAEKGSGVTRNGERLATPAPSRPSADGAEDGGASMQPLRAGGTKKVWRCFDSSDGFAEPIGSNFCAGFDYPQLLTGGADFFVYRNPKPWDHLPGLLMLSELGGVISQVDGQPYGPASRNAEAICCAPNPGVAKYVTGRWRGPADK